MGKQSGPSTGLADELNGLGTGLGDGMGWDSSRMGMGSSGMRIGSSRMGMSSFVMGLDSAGMGMGSAGMGIDSSSTAGQKLAAVFDPGHLKDVLDFFTKLELEVTRCKLKPVDPPCSKRLV